MTGAFSNLLEGAFKVNRSPELQEKISTEKKWFGISQQIRHASLGTHFQHKWVMLSPPVSSSPYVAQYDFLLP